MHRDLKPENVLVNVDRQGQITSLKLADFGQGCKIYKNTMCSAKFGTKGYIAPEALSGYVRFDQKVDSWSLGILLYNLVCGNMPFTGSEKRIKFLCLNKSPQYNEQAWGQCSDDLRDLVKGLLHRDSTLRFSMEEALSHRCLRGSRRA